MARRHLHHVTIVSSRETGVPVAVVVGSAVAVAAAATAETTVVRMEDLMEGHHLDRTGGATSCWPCGALSLFRLYIRQTNVISNLLTCKHCEI